MILVISVWILIFFSIFIFGTSVFNIIERFSNDREPFKSFSFDKIFFLGFVTLSSLCGILSILVPIGKIITILFLVIICLLLITFYSAVTVRLNEFLDSFRLFDKRELIFIFFLSLFILTAVIQEISFYDTALYHAQTIQWIKKFAVVPGLGNIDERLAFNSMFFPVSALFTFHMKDSMIFPLNGLCYFVLILKLFFLVHKEMLKAQKWKAVFYILLVLISVLTLSPNLNSASPDVICSILILYILIYIVDIRTTGEEIDRPTVYLLGSMVFTCVGFKLSSLFLIAIIFLILKNIRIRELLILLLIGCFILLPFLIRNYYLSGYLLFPFPAIDLFNVDWKIAKEDVIAIKQETENFAKISTLPSPEVVKMKIFEWIIPWFKSLNFNFKAIVVIDILSIFSFFIIVLKKEFTLSKILLIVYLNILFWFLMAPDPRFAYGFLFFCFSLTISYFIKLLEISRWRHNILSYVRFGMSVFLLAIILRHISYPFETIKTPSLLLIPAKFGKVATTEYDSGFKYRVPVTGDQSYYSEIPCVPYPLKNIEPRGPDLQNGFRVRK